MFEWLDEWWRGVSEGGGGGGGTVGMYAWNLGMSQYGYIGQYLGAYAAVRSDMADLEHPFSGYGPDMERRSWERVQINGQDYYVRTDSDGVYDLTNLVPVGPPGSGSGSGGSRASLLKDPNLIADNSALPARFGAPETQPEKLGAPRGEVSIDLGPEGPPPSARDWSSVVPGVERKPRQDDNAPHGGSSYAPADEWMPPGERRPVYGPSSSSQSSSEPTSVAGPSTPSRSWNSPESPPSLPPAGPPPPSMSAEPPRPSSSNVINLPEVTVYGKIPFEPNVSVPGAYERANRVGRIEWTDLVGFARGAWNGLFSASQSLERLVFESSAGPLFGPLVTPLLEPLIKRSDAFKLSIDPDQGAGALIGEHISENLVFEALPFLPQIAQAGGRALKGARVADMLATPVFWFTGAGGIGSRGGRYARLLRARSAAPVYSFVGWTRITSEAAWARYQAGVGSQWEAVFEINQGGTTRHILVDHLALQSRKELSSIVEAKFGDMGQMWIPEREAHILQQAREYLALREALGFKNVRYVVSTPLGAERLNIVFAREFPSAVQNSLLTVEFQPMRW
jgi:hypothetical protein